MESERQVNRILKLSRREPLDALAVFELDQWDVAALQRARKRLLLLLHPDKSRAGSEERFRRAFDVVMRCSEMLADEKKAGTSLSMGQAQLQPEARGDVDGNEAALDVYRGAKQLRVMLSEVGGVEELREHEFTVVSHIAVNGAEHTKNVSKAKRDKHQKGLKQRADAKRAAERRLRRKQFAFTQNFEITKK